jgi:SAM-dependent methyltransferase
VPWLRHFCDDDGMRQGSISYAPIADRYERVRGGVERAAEIADALRPWVPDGVVCDVGAGTAVVTERLARPGVELLACDLSLEMISQARARLPSRLHVADATSLALRSSSVDAILFVWVLHHVGDLGAALREAWRALRDGGRVLSVSGFSLPVSDGHRSDPGYGHQPTTERVIAGARQPQTRRACRRGPDGHDDTDGGRHSYSAWSIVLDDVAGAVRLDGARRPSRSRLARGARREAVIDG